MENNSSTDQGNKFFNGFLLGMLVGAAIVFFLGTKKGKRIWKVITDEGMGNISNILDRVKSSVDLDEVMEDSIDTMPRENPIEEIKPKVKRFFRGISRRPN